MFERKVIHKGQGYRITGIREAIGWRRGTPMTLVVRMPNLRNPVFSVRSVVTEGIQGQPQLTFDSEEAAQQYLNMNPSLPEYYHVGWTNKDYDCIKIPLVCENGEVIDGWLAVSNFPPEGSQGWDWLKRTFPEYFRTGPGFFNENITEAAVNRNLSEEEIKEILEDDSLSDEELARALWDRPLEKVIKAGNIYFYLRRPFRVEHGELDIFKEHDINDITEIFHDVHYNYRDELPLSVFMGPSGPDSPYNIRTSFRWYVQHGNANARRWWEYVTKLIEAYEKYGYKLGFFNENLNLNEAYQETEVETHDSWKIKTPGSYCYRIKINLPNSRFHTFRWALSRMTSYGGGPGWQEACFLTQHDAEEFIRVHNLGNEWYAYSARVPLTLVKVPLEDGSEVYLRKEAFPREYNPYTDEENEEAHAWWEDMRQRYPDYFGQYRLGFFNEDINTKWDVLTEDLGRSFNNSREIYDIMEDPNSSIEQKSQRLFNRDHEHVEKFGRYSLQYPERQDIPEDVDRNSLYRVRDRSMWKDTCPTVHVSTLLVKSGMHQPFDIKESWDYYVMGRPSQYFNSTHCAAFSENGHEDNFDDCFSGALPIHWWRYITQVVSIWEEALHYKPYKLGFFKESLDADNRIHLEIGDILKTHGDGTNRTPRTDDVQWEVANITPEYRPGEPDHYMFDMCHFLVTNLTTGDTTTWGMTSDTSEQKFNKEGFVFEYNGRSYPPTHRLGFFSEDYHGKTDDELNNFIFDTLNNQDLSDEEKVKLLFDRNLEEIGEISDVILLLRWLWYVYTKDGVEGFSKFIKGDESQRGDIFKAIDHKWGISHYINDIILEVLAGNQQVINNLENIDNELKRYAAECGHSGYSPFYSGRVGRDFNPKYDVFRLLRPAFDKEGYKQWRVAHYKALCDMLDYVESNFIPKLGFFHN